MNVSRLRSVLNYDPRTGVFRWAERPSPRVRVGDVAGTVNGHGYLNIGFDGRTYKAHRLAWLYVHGEWPVGQIDHRNGDRTDNRLANLRVVTNAENLRSARRARSDSATGLVGVSRAGGRYRARMMVNGQSRSLGTYDTPEQAHAAYLAAK
jgi:hypothetical protein